ncbi:MAG: DUF1990 family protein [Gemmataceae bacterium]
MFHLARPGADAIQAFLQAQATLELSYGPLQITRSPDRPPAGFQLDRSRIRLGSGEKVFATVCSALRHWEQFRLGWVEPFPGNTPLESGQCVAVVAHALGLWVVCSCRIVYTIDEPRRFGFAYGTLPGHVERGEELFLIERDENDDVWYEIVALSRPNHWLAWLGYPYTRWLQARFRRDSSQVMQRAVLSVDQPPK